MPSSSSTTKKAPSIDVDRAIRVNKGYGYSTSLWKDIQKTVGTTPDGIVGKNTVNCIASWQTKYFSGSSVDGIFGKNSLAKMKGTFGSTTGTSGNQTSGSTGSDTSTASGKITEHFSWNEFKCRDGKKVPVEYQDNTRKLCKNLEIIRRESGNKSIRIVSGYRSPSYNQSIGGATKSQHMYGTAADITIAGMNGAESYAFVDKLAKQGKIHNGGVGKYSGFTHYDVRSSKARW